MLKKVSEYVDSHGLAAGIDGIVCAYSGGADSSVMLRILSELCRERGISLRAVHINHSIRGAEADRDERFCAETCGNLNIPFKAIRVDAPALAAERKIGMEEAARELRYAALEADLKPGEVIATAHNATDNAETLFYNLIRGTGIKGLSGIPPKRDRIIRPILCLDRDEIREYAAACRIEYIYDSTNDDLCHPRNSIRAKIIPAAKEINPGFEANVLSLSDILRDEEKCLSELSGEVEILRDEEGNSVSLSDFDLCAEPIKYRILREMFSLLGGKRLSRANVLDVLNLCKRSVGGSSVNLPGGIAAKIFKKRLVFQKNEMPESARAVPQSGIIEPGGTISFGEYELFVAESGDELKKLRNVYKLFIFDKINFDTINGSLFVRARSAGDGYTARGITKALRRRMSELGIPADKRDSFPVVCDGDGVLWLPGDSVADRCYPRESGKITYICCGKK